ncbi:MAG: AAA family ATPase [Burkholderiaceae bacterium]|nr:AAA family ATPase [Burkholderiaceae bacterium]
MGEQHPLLRSRGARTRTAPLDEAIEALSLVLQTAELGMVTSAPTRWGKSTFLDELEARFEKARSGVVMRSTMLADSATRFENRFYRRLRGEEEGEESAFPQQNPKMALLRHIQNECDKVQTTLVVFALDEAQNLTVHQLDLLKVLTENLLNMGFKPFVLLVGQPEVLLLREWLREHSRQDIVQRFMLRAHALRGIRSAQELRPLLRDADQAIWPVDSNRSHTQHFAPIAWERGWRLEREAEGLWQTFVLHAKSIGLNAERLEVGTQFIAQAKLALLQGTIGTPQGVRDGASQLLVDPHRPLRPGHELLQAAVEHSGFREFQNLGAKPVDPGSPTSKQARRWMGQLRPRQ